MTTPTTAPAAPKQARPERTIGVPFEKGHHRGRPKGSIDRRRVAGMMAAKAIEARAWDVLFALLQARAWRPRFEAARLVLAYSIGLPRQTLELTGGLGDLSKELAAALQEARARRAAHEGGLPAQAIVGAARGIVEASAALAFEAPALVVEIVKTGEAADVPEVAKADGADVPLVPEVVKMPKAGAS